MSSEDTDCFSEEVETDLSKDSRKHITFQLPLLEWQTRWNQGRSRKRRVKTNSVLSVLLNGEYLLLVSEVNINSIWEKIKAKKCCMCMFRITVSDVLVFSHYMMTLLVFSNFLCLEIYLMWYQYSHCYCFWIYFDLVCFFHLYTFNLPMFLNMN